MKISSLNILLATVLGITTVSAVNAAPASYKTPSTIIYDQQGNDPFPTSAPEVRDSGAQVLVYHEGGSDPFPTSAPEFRSSEAKVIAYHEGGTDPFPPAAPEAGVAA